MLGSYAWTTIRASKYGGFDVHGFKDAPANSVLAGNTLKCFVNCFPTLEEAKAVYPEATMGSSFTDPVVSLGHLPDENTPVAGGMYPDDYNDYD